MVLLLNAAELKTALIHNVINANVFACMGVNSSVADAERLNTAHETLESIADSLDLTVNLSQFFVVTGHYEGDSPITEIIHSADSEQVDCLFKKRLNDKFGSDLEIHIDSISTLSTMLSKVEQ